MHFLFALLLLLLPAAGTHAQELADYDYENLHLAGLGVDFGGLSPTLVEPTLTIGVRADLGFLGPGVRIMPAIRFWSSELREDEGFDDARVAALALELDGHYVWTEFVGDPYAGAGVGLHFLNGSGSSIGGTFVEDLLDTALPAINVMGGVSFPLGPQLRVFTEARGVLATEVQYAALLVGGILNLSRRSR